MTTTYFASIGELFLIGSLIYLIVKVKLMATDEDSKLPALAVASGALLVMVAAGFGVFRFAGFDQIIDVHDATSFYAKHLGMVFYATGIAWLLLGDKYREPIVIIAVLGLSSTWPFLGFLADVSIFSLLALTAYQSPYLKQIASSLVVLLLVPLTQFLPASLDSQMGIFHLLLAVHFAIVARVMMAQSRTVNMRD
jgi:hypothetical protein